ncbi:hypothetical protein [Prevotella sp. HUN102]|uniref:hypothetical protein n=1 Tax=Prevotella sp. HUN102 TaxID=1392486 RepID=UPI0004909B03|nr:hypothetical protein [Prevotella sp. HUN102]
MYRKLLIILLFLMAFIPCETFSQVLEKIEETDEIFIRKFYDEINQLYLRVQKESIPGYIEVYNEMLSKVLSKYCCGDVSYETMYGWNELDVVLFKGTVGFTVDGITPIDKELRIYDVDFFEECHKSVRLQLTTQEGSKKIYAVNHIKRPVVLHNDTVKIIGASNQKFYRVNRQLNVSDYYELVDSCKIRRDYEVFVFSPSQRKQEDVVDSLRIYADRLLLIYHKGKWKLYDNVISNLSVLEDGALIFYETIVKDSDDDSDFCLSFMAGQGYKKGWKFKISMKNNDLIIDEIAYSEHSGGLYYQKFIVWNYNGWEEPFILRRYNRFMIYWAENDRNPIGYYDH